MLGLHQSHRIEVFGFGFGIGMHRGFTQTNLDDALLLLAEFVPLTLVHQEFGNRNLLMPAGEIVVLRNLVEAELGVDRRHGEFRGVNDATFQSRIDVRSREKLGLCAHLRHDLGTKTEETHLQALDLIERGNFGLEPAGSFRADCKAIERNQVMLGIDFVTKFLASAEPFPGHEFTNLRAKRNRREERQGRVFRSVVARCRPAGFNRTLGSGIKAFERGDKCAGLEEFDVDVAAGHDLDVFGEADT